MPKICLDAGHYAKYNWNKNTNPIYWESLMAWSLHLKLKEELEKYNGIEVITTRKEEEKDMDLMARGRAAIGCDLFLSLHSNACNTESVDRAVVIYPVSGKEMPLADSLGICISEVMNLKDKHQLYFKWNSSHTADYYGVMRGAASVGVPALILEHSFHTNNRSANWLLKEENLAELAKAEAKVIADRFKCKPKTEEMGSIYALPLRVQIGAYNKPANAIAMLQEAHEKGFEYAYIVDVNGKPIMF